MRDLKALNLRTISCKVAEQRKYSCFRRSSLPSNIWRREEEGGGGKEGREGRRREWDGERGGRREGEKRRDGREGGEERGDHDYAIHLHTHRRTLSFGYKTLVMFSAKFLSRTALI